MKHLIIFCFVFLVTADFSSAAVNAPDFSLEGEGDTVYSLSDFKGKPLVLFFFSYSCPHCEKAIPAVKELYKRSDGKYNILGIVYGTPREDLRYKAIETGTEFPVAVGTKAIAENYKITGTPFFWLIGTDGTIRERFYGGKVAELLTPGIPLNVESRLGLYELCSNPKDYEGKTIETGGWLIQTSPSYFSKPVFMIANGVDQVRVSSWLPLEAVPSPKGFKKQRKDVMSDFLDKYVIISGRVILEDGKPVIEVKDARLLQ